MHHALVFRLLHLARLLVRLLLKTTHYSRWISSNKFTSSLMALLWMIYHVDGTWMRCGKRTMQDGEKNVVKSRQISHIKCIWWWYTVGINTYTLLFISRLNFLLMLYNNVMFRFFRSASGGTSYNCSCSWHHKQFSFVCFKSTRSIWRQVRLKQLYVWAPK